MGRGLICIRRSSDRRTNTDPKTGSRALWLQQTLASPGFLHHDDEVEPTVKPTFTLFGIPVRVVSSFWMMAVLFGMVSGGGETNPGRAFGAVAASAAVVFVSIMLHEFGHALMARRFGLTPSITLYALGGLTHFEGGRLSRPQTCLVSFAGPAVGLVLGMPIFLVARAHPLSGAAQALIPLILWVNVGWSLINLLPVVPFDGGHIMAAILGPRRALWSAIISAVVGSAAAAGGFLFFRSIWGAFLFGSATFNAVRQARRIWDSRREVKDGIGAEMDSVRAAMQRGSSREVLSMAQGIVDRARSAATKNAGLLALAWAHATEGRTAEARSIVENLERDVPPDPYLFAALEDALGAPERARAWLEAGRQKGWRRPDTTKLLIDLYARDSQMSRAAEVAAEDLEILGRDDARAVVSAAMHDQAYRAAARLAERIFEVWGDPADALDEARARAMSGDAARALALLEQLAGESDAGAKSPFVLQREALRSDAAFQSLRGQARFERLLDQPAGQTPG
jgi:Zn-dependent protease